MNSGLVNVLNLPITDHSEIMNFKNGRRSLTEILERTHNKTVSKDFRKLIFNVNILEIKIHDKISVIPPIIDIPSTYLFRKTDDRVITIGLDTT